MIAVKKPLFKLGQIVATPRALEAFEKSRQNCLELIVRHVAGDWGTLSEDDRRLNDEAVKDGSRILSAFVLKDGHTRVWVITEAADDDGNRAATTCILPDEY